MLKKLVLCLFIFIFLLIPETVIGTPYLFSTHQDNSLRSISFKQNNPPENVSINGPTRGETGTLYEYSFYCDDPEGDKVNYYIKWGTPSCPIIYGPFPSSSPTIIGVVWDKIGRYDITVKAVDVHGAESDIISLPVTMPLYPLLNRIKIFFPFFQSLIP